MKKVIFIALFFTIASLIYASQSIYQVSTIQSLLNGIFEKAATVKNVNSHSTIGLGAGVGLGEVIQYEGICYIADENGALKIMTDKEGISYFTGTKINKDTKHTFKLEKINSEKEIESTLDNKLKNIDGLNIFYAMTITGNFNVIEARSEIVPKLHKYEPLIPWMKKYQHEFSFNNEKAQGTIIGIRSPDFIKDIGVFPYHFHYISNDKKWGGHVLNFSVENATVKVYPIYNMNLVLPKNNAYKNMKVNHNSDIAFKNLETKNVSIK